MKKPSKWARKADAKTAKAINELARIRAAMAKLRARSKTLCATIVEGGGGQTTKWEARIYHLAPKRGYSYRNTKACDRVVLVAVKGA